MTQPPAIGHEVLYDVYDHVAVLQFNRPEKRNAISAAMAEALGWAVTQVEQDRDIRVAILASSTAGIFSAGADLAEIARTGGRSLMTAEGGFAGFIDAKREKPWIAAVDGPAVGGAFEIALACDMILTTPGSYFGLPEVKRGILAGAGGAFRLPRALPRAIALELLATGEPLNAKRAEAFGLVNRIVDARQLLSTVRALADNIAANAPLSVTASLSIARQAYDLSVNDLRSLSNELSRLVSESEDASEGPRAFLEKRRPNWNGR